MQPRTGCRFFQLSLALFALAVFTTCGQAQPRPAVVGIRGGEFSRLVIKRWGIRPPLWIINADDQFVHFFSGDLSLTLGPEKTPIAAASRSRIRGWLAVVGRDLRWRMEDIYATFRQGIYSLSPSTFGLYRNVVNGDMLLDSNPAYVAGGNKPMRLARDVNCHTNPAVVAYARRFLEEVGRGDVPLARVGQDSVGRALQYFSEHIALLRDGQAVTFLELDVRVRRIAAASRSLPGSLPRSVATRV